MCAQTEVQNLQYEKSGLVADKEWGEAEWSIRHETNQQDKIR